MHTLLTAALASLIVTLFTLLLGILAGWSIAHLRAYVLTSNRRLTALEEQVKALQAAQAKRLPYKTADEIENATAALLKLKFQHDFRGEIIENALGHLQVARNGSGKEK